MDICLLSRFGRPTRLCARGERTIYGRPTCWPPEVAHANSVLTVEAAFASWRHCDPAASFPAPSRLAVAVLRRTAQCRLCTKIPHHELYGPRALCWEHSHSRVIHDIPLAIFISEAGLRMVSLMPAKVNVRGERRRAVIHPSLV